MSNVECRILNTVNDEGLKSEKGKVTSLKNHNSLLSCQQQNDEGVIRGVDLISSQLPYTVHFLKNSSDDFVNFRCQLRVDMTIETYGVFLLLNRPDQYAGNNCSGQGAAIAKNKNVVFKVFEH